MCFWAKFKLRKIELAVDGAKEGKIMINANVFWEKD